MVAGIVVPAVKAENWTERGHVKIYEIVILEQGAIKNCEYF